MPGLLTADALSPALLGGQPQWGIFDATGGPILVSDLVFAVEYDRDYHISNAPQEQGAFESYNKVQVPFKAKVSLVSEQTREELLSTIEAAVASLDLATVVTPEITYPSANLTHYGYRREARNGGVTMIRIDVWCEEVRIVGDVQQSAPGTQSTNGAPERQNGNVQASANASELNPPT